MLLNATETAKYIGTSRNRFYDLLEVDPTFPKPITIKSSRRLWDPARLDAWKDARFDAVNNPIKKGRAK